MYYAALRKPSRYNTVSGGELGLYLIEVFSAVISPFVYPPPTTYFGKRHP